jgi:hypothetical protein
MLQRAFGASNPPEKITQEAWDRDDGHLHRLLRLRPGDRAGAKDLWDYTQDLLNTEIQGALLAHSLPFCLEAWREDLIGVSTEYAGFVDWFYPVLAVPIMREPGFIAVTDNRFQVVAHDVFSATMLRRLASPNFLTLDTNCTRPRATGRAYRKRKLARGDRMARFATYQECGGGSR